MVQQIERSKLPQDTMDDKTSVNEGHEEVSPEVVAFEERMKKWLHEAISDMKIAGISEERANEVVWSVLDRLIVSE